MATSFLTKESLKLKQLIYNFGTISIGQVFKLFPKANEDSVRFYIMALIKKQLANIVNDKYLVPAVKKEADESMVEALWIMLDMLKCDGISDELELSFAGEQPVKVCFMKDGVLYEIVPINKYTINNINYIAEKTNARTIDKDKADDLTRYVFVIKDEEMLERIGEYQIQFPHSIALISDTGDDAKPDIRYYEATN